jgi:hypothetical protein
MTIWAFGALQLGILDLIIGKRRSLVTRVSQLPAAFSLAAALTLRFGFFDNITGGWLRRVGGILLGGREFRPEFCHLHAEFFHHLHQSDASLTTWHFHADYGSKPGRPQLRQLLSNIA